MVGEVKPIARVRIGRNMRHLLTFMDNHGEGRFSFAYRDKATRLAVKRCELAGLVEVDWITNQIVRRND